MDIAGEWRGELEPKGNPWLESRGGMRRRYQRARLAVEGGSVYGICSEIGSGTVPHAVDVNLQLEELAAERAAGGQAPSGARLTCIVRREFILQDARHGVEWRERRADEARRREIRQRFDAYLRDRRPLGARLRGDEVHLENLDVPDGAGDWTRCVPLREEEVPWVLGAPYSPDNVRVALSERPAAPGSWQASYRDVPAIDVDDFRRQIRAGFADNFRLSKALYYVGMAAPPVAGGDAPAEVVHRFEWGFGHTLLVPEAALQFHGKPFRSAQFLLFHGDKVTTVRFPKPADEPGPSVLDLVDISVSRKRDLYEQARRSVVHQVDIVVEGNRVRVERVYTYDNAPTAQPIGKSREEASVPVRATMTDVPEALLARIARQSRNRPVRLLGRLNTRHFEETQGLEMIFAFTRLTLSPDAPDGLKPSERVFLQAGNIEERNNEMLLQLAPPGELHPAGVDPSFRKDLALLRREFSVREDLLKQIREESGPGALAGSLLLVRLKRLTDTGRVQVSLREGAPERGSNVLRGLIAAAPQLLTYAAVERQEPKELTLEFQPGLLIDLRRQEIHDHLPWMPPGTIVRVQAGPGRKFTIALAQHGDSAFIGDESRPAVVLPKNVLLNARELDLQALGAPGYWRRDVFTVADLPGAVAHLQAGGDPVAAGFELMTRPHPRIVGLRRVGGASLEIGAPPGDVVAGMLVIDPKDLSVRCRPVPPGDLESGARRLEWAQLSFSDEPASRIASRCEKLTWRYHDTTTGHWTQTDPTLQVHRRDLAPASAATEPVFFLSGPDGLRLRYPSGSLWRFGLPTAHLLAIGTKDMTLTVAGVVYDSTGGSGLWLELGPGRIAQLLGELLVYRVGVEAREFSLAHFHWEAFAPGDRLTVQVDTGQHHVVSRVVLKSWQPSPRGAFGPGRTLLEVQPNGQGPEARGGLRLGSGLFQLTYPVEPSRSGEPWAGARAVWVDGENRIAPWDPSSPPRRGDVVLVGIRDDGRLFVHGADSLAARPAEEGPVGANDPLVPHLRDPLRVAGLFRACGGALPVTVEAVDADGTLVVSRRLQRRLPAAGLPPGRIGQAQVLGPLADGHAVLLRHGSALLPVAVDRIIAGLPAAMHEKAMEWLRAHRDEPIWLRATETGLETGLKAMSAHAMVLDPLDVLDTTGAQGIESSAGLIARDRDSLSLAWIDAADLAWAPLTAEQVRRHFVSESSGPVRAGWTRDRRLSRTALPEAAHEIQSLTIGQELRIEVIEEPPAATAAEAPPAGRRTGLARSYNTDVILALEVAPHDTVRKGDVIAAEVSRRIIGDCYQLTVTRLGRRSYVPDLPTWLLSRPQKPSLLDRFARYARPSAAATDPGGRLAEAYHNIHWDDPKSELSVSQAHEAMDALRDWKGTGRQGPQDAEMDLPPALQGVLLQDLLGRNPPLLARALGQSLDQANREAHERQSDAAYQAWLIGQRALRSLHVWVLSDLWVRNETNRDKTGGLWSRLNRHVSGDLGPEMSREEALSLQRFCRAVLMKEAIQTGNAPAWDSQSELTQIAHALSAALGDLITLSGLPRPSERNECKLWDLINLARCLTPRGTRWPYLLPSHRTTLRRVLGYITDNRIDITLLPGLPRVAPARPPSHH
jgi:hypothetical protein